MINCNPNKLLSNAYKCNFKMMTTYNLNSIWLQNVKEYFAMISCEDIWSNSGDEYNDFPTVLIYNLKDLHYNGKTHLHHRLCLKQLRAYAKFKSKFEFENI